MRTIKLLRNRSSHPGKKSKGAAAIEYAVIAGLVAVAILSAGGEIGEKVGNIFSYISEKMPEAPGEGGGEG